MLAHLSISAKQVLELSSRLTGDRDDEDQRLVINLEVLLQDLALHVPDVWGRVAALYGESVHPACCSLRTMLGHDVEQMEKLFLDFETALDNDDDADFQHFKASDSDSPCPMNLAPDICCDFSNDASTSRNQWRRSHWPSPHNFQVPQIVLTTCPSQPPETLCRVPIQDSAYNQRLTVPTHTTVNSVFPPMRARSPPVKTIKDWIWRDGHWQAILPDLDEQTRRGIFSRPSSNIKRRASRCRMCCSVTRYPRVPAYY
ncbi:uncharacterized protein BT62DRAFT_285037 [Guyanagaster necrorhizus]|uniref:Uncharacterized protein n=1 Tax=Guyanagaster necrorhizus TaxID=856835 RepID=A0A9P7W3V6_9AGAR|nr:uncharacterized protein BT62DRAFT_285037 [Guyanagaster necrorhizus MCA 3950]KAG7452143.1 hypothetical protein BT62DRAFT_285037 [Guyanagaster necrorhizus MCA 3950]